LLASELVTVMMWYKIKKYIYCNEFFYLNSNEKLFMWYKKWKKWEYFDVDFYW
jgi:hypothetical protein